MTVNEGAVKEMAGVRGATEWVSLREGGLTINLQVRVSDTDLNVDQARRLARQLYRLARRVEKRITPKPTEPLL